jgi:hypothetical protein
MIKYLVANATLFYLFWFHRYSYIGHTLFCLEFALWMNLEGDWKLACRGAKLAWLFRVKVSRGIVPCPPRDSNPCLTYQWLSRPSIWMSASVSEALLSFRLSISYSMIMRTQAHCPLKVVGNEKWGRSGGWLQFEDAFGPWRSMSVCFLMLLSSFLQSISISCW